MTRWRTNHRAVSVVIATLLLVAISVVGGIIVFAFSQGFFNQAQISGTPTIELVKILGYDARDVEKLNVHDGTQMDDETGGDPVTQGKNVDERVAVYIKNDSVEPIMFAEIRLGGTVYTYDTSDEVPDWDSSSDLVPGEYSILTNSTGIIQDQVGVAQAGQTVTLLFDLDENFPIGRDIQFQLTTTNGAVFVGTVVMGQNPA